MLSGVARQLLQNLGCQPTQSQELVGSNAENPSGFFESQLLVQTNEHLLGLVNASWDRPFLAVPAWQNPQLFEKLVALRERFSAYWQEPWIDKDPRMCLLWGVYRHILLRDPVGVAVVRNPLSVAASLELRNNFTQTKSAIIWWLYYYHLLKASDSSRLLTICDATLLLADPGCISAIGRFMHHHAVLPDTISESASQAELSRLIHQRCQQGLRRALPADPAPGGLLAKAHQLWLRWQDAGCSDQVWREGFETIPAQLLDCYEEEVGQGIHDAYPPLTRAFAERCEILQSNADAIERLRHQLQLQIDDICQSQSQEREDFQSKLSALTANEPLLQARLAQLEQSTAVLSADLAEHLRPKRWPLLQRLRQRLGRIRRRLLTSSTN